MRRPVSFGRSRGGGRGGNLVGHFVRNSPVTAAILGLAIAGFLGLFFLGRYLPVEWMVFTPSRFFVFPWTALTFPFVPTEQPFFFLLTLYWAWVVGRELEGAVGPLRFALLFCGATASSALPLLVYSRLFHGADVPVAGLYLPLAALTVAWALRNPERVVLFSFIVPLSGKVLAIVTVVLVYFSNGPVRGFFALGGCFYALAWVQWGRRHRFRASSARFGRAAPERLSLLDRFRLWRARRRMKKVWDADRPDRFVN